MGKSTKNQENKLKSNKDSDYHGRINEFIALAFQIISAIVGHKQIETTSRWVGKIKIATKALDMLKHRASSSVPNHEPGDEVYGYLEDLLELPEDKNFDPEEALKKAKVELKYKEEELKKMNDALERTQQSLQETQEKNNALKRRVEVLDSQSNIVANSFLSEDGANKVQGTHANGSVDLDIEGEQGFRWDFESLREFFLGAGKGEGSSNADETCIVRGYTVFKRNANVLNEILEAYPNIIAENFGAAHPDLQRYLMNSLAELYQKIKGDQPEMLDLKEIEGMELKILDMERNGLQQLSWLNDMLTEVREMLENEAERKRLEEQMANLDAREEKAKQEAEEARQEKKQLELELAKLGKKPRLN